MLFFLVTTPWACTACGSDASAAEMRFWTRICALSRSVPTVKVTVREYVPSLAEVDCM